MEISALRGRVAGMVCAPWFAFSLRRYWVWSLVDDHHAPPLLGRYEQANPIQAYIEYRISPRLATTARLFRLEYKISIVLCHGITQHYSQAVPVVISSTHGYRDDQSCHR